MEQRSLADRLSREIVDTIRSQRLRPGQALPTARQLAERFEVTVPTVREALRRLEATNIIELRHGSGTYVGNSVDRSFLINPFIAEATMQSALELAEARLVLEPEVAAEAARKRTPELADRLAVTLANALEPDGVATPAASSFHAELAAVTGNPVLTELIGTLLDVRGKERRAIRSVYRDRERDHAEHRDIYEAVAAGDEAAARTLTAAHLTHIRDHLRAELKKGVTR